MTVFEPLFSLFSSQFTFLFHELVINSKLVLNFEEKKSQKFVMEGTIRCSANYVPLSPISFLERAAVVYGNRISIVYGDVKFTWAETRQRCLKLASALIQLGISRGDVVMFFSSFFCFISSVFSLKNYTSVPNYEVSITI